MRDDPVLDTDPLSCNVLTTPDTLALGIAFSTANSNQDVFQKDVIRDCVDADDECDFSDSTPVTLSYFYTSKSSEGTKFEWSTATEVGNLGFNIYGVINGSKQRLNESTILSKKVDSLSPLDYQTTIENSDADSFYISDVDLKGKEKLHGPFALGKSYGEKVKAEKIDWVKINSEINIKKTLSVESKKLNALKKTASLKSKSSKLIKTSAVTLESLYPKASIKVTEDEVYRVYYQDLADIGLDLSGVNINSLALTHKGVPEPIYISSTDEVFNAGDYFEFAGQSINTLYTDTNVYILEVNSAIAERVSINSKSIKNNATFEQSYLEKLVIGNNNTYTFSSPSSDPWIDSRLFATPSSPVTKVYSFDLDNLASPNGGNLNGILWGLTDFPFNPDHHVNIKLNGVQVEDKIFNGLTLIDLNADLNKLGVTLLESSNQLEINIPAETAASFDIVDIDSFTVSFERNFIANDGKLVYSDNGNAFDIQNLLSSDLTVYSRIGNSVSKHTNIEITENGGIYSVKFAGDKNNLIKNYVFEESSVLSPELEIAPDTDGLKTGQAQYLIISHPSFINDLGALIAERQNQFSVKLANVEAVYTEFNGGIFDPEAIRKYIDFAVNNLGTVHVLLVGGDSYDYLL